MDRRWLGILIIFIVGISCMYLIVDSSTTVGTAITIVNKTVITLPGDFSIEENENSYGVIVNKDTHEKVCFKDLGKKDIALDQYNNQLEKLNHDSGVEITNKSTSDIGNITTYKIDCKNYTTENTTNFSIIYAYTCYHTFKITMKNFNDENKLNNNLNYIISNMEPDFKQSQD